MAHCFSLTLIAVILIIGNSNTEGKHLAYKASRKIDESCPNYSTVKPNCSVTTNSDECGMECPSGKNCCPGKCGGYECISTACTCSVLGDPLLRSFNGSRVAILEAGQYFLHVSGDDKLKNGRKDSNYLSLYCIVGQANKDLYPGQLRVERISFKYGNDTLSMEKDKVKVNSRLALASLPYTKQNCYTISEIIRSKKSKILTFRSTSGIIIQFSPNEPIKILVIFPRHVLSKNPTGLCKVCP